MSDQRGVTGPGNTVVLNYIDPASGEETYVTRLSAPGLPPAEYMAWHELQRIGVPAEAVHGVHSDLEPSVLPGGYPRIFLSRTFPKAKLSCSHGYGGTAEERAENVAKLQQHAGLMASIAGGTAPPPMNRVPIPQDVRPVPPLPDHELGRQLATVFGPQEVLRHPPEFVHGHRLLPESSKATLAQAGLPASVPFFFVADGPGNPPPGGLFTDVATHMRACGEDPGENVMNVLAEYVRIGTDGVYTIAVQCKGPDHLVGSVWAANPETGAGRYMNASVAALARCLALLHVARTHLVDRDPAGAGDVLTGFQRQLAGIDATAVKDERTWWSLVIEQMWHGLF